MTFKDHYVEHFLHSVCNRFPAPADILSAGFELGICDPLSCIASAITKTLYEQSE